MYIENLPDNACAFEFIVIEPITTKKYLFIGHYSSIEEAERAVYTSGSENTFIFHNIKVDGYKKLPTYTFSGTWRWSCKAFSEAEAWDKFSNDLSIDPSDMFEDVKCELDH